MMQFREIEIDFDLYDADNAEAYEAALDNFNSAAKKIPATSTLAASIRYQCEMVFDFFDDLFGDGFHKQVFGERTNLVECLDTFEEFTKLIAEQKKALTDRVAAIQAQNGNRATRRASSRAPTATAKK